MTEPEVESPGGSRSLPRWPLTVAFPIFMVLVVSLSAGAFIFGLKSRDVRQFAQRTECARAVGAPQQEARNEADAALAHTLTDFLQLSLKQAQTGVRATPADLAKIDVDIQSLLAKAKVVTNLPSLPALVDKSCPPPP